MDATQQRPEGVTESVESLIFKLETASVLFRNATSRKDRCEDLMKRKSTSKWSPKKTAKMVRRFVTASKETEKLQVELDQLVDKLSAAGVEVGVASRKQVVG